MAFTYVTVTETYETSNDLPASGKVEFCTVAPMHNGVTVVSAPIVATLNSAGVMSATIAATTDPTTKPVGVTYQVTERITGQPTLIYFVSVPHNQGSTLTLSNLTVTAGGAAGFELRDALDYDDSVAPTDGQVVTWESSTSKFRAENPTGAVTSVNGSTGAVSITAGGIGAQPVDTDLTVIAGLTPADDDFVQRKASAWANRTVAQVRTDLGVNPAITLATLADAKGDVIAASAADTWARVAVGANGTALTADSATSTGVAWATPWATVASNVGTSSYTLGVSDAGKVVEINSATAQTVTVPANSSQAFPIGSVVEICRMGTGTLTVVAAGGVTVRTPTGMSLRAQYSAASVRKRDTDEWVLGGDLA